jgi:hypothetical protein
MTSTEIALPKNLRDVVQKRIDQLKAMKGETRQMSLF